MYIVYIVYIVGAPLASRQTCSYSATGIPFGQLAKVLALDARGLGFDPPPGLGDTSNSNFIILDKPIYTDE